MTRPVGAATTEELLARLERVTETYIFEVGGEIDRLDQQELGAAVLVAILRLRQCVERDGVAGERTAEGA